MSAGATEIALLKCTSAYPSPPESVNLRAIPAMAERWGLPVGLSDHTLGDVVAIGAVALGACILEKHFKLAGDDASPDAAFSLDPAGVRARWSNRSASPRPRSARRSSDRPTRRRRAGGSAARCSSSRTSPRGTRLTEANVRSIRPADGLHTRHYEEVLGRRAAHAISRGTPLSWDLLEPPPTSSDR